MIFFLEIIMNLNTDISNHIPPGVVLPNQQDLQGLSLQIPNAIPPHVVNFNVDGDDFDNEEEPVPTTPFQKAGKLRIHLQKTFSEKSQRLKIC